ncbi:MAG: AraC family transcriptional regulator [Ferruginibacter sp.]
MFLRFPEIVPGYKKDNTLIFKKIPYALFSIEKAEGKKTVFLTEHTLLFILNGEKQIHLNEETIHVSKNEIIFLRKGIYAMSEYFPKDENFEVLLIFIPDTFLQKFIFDYQSNPLQQYNHPYFLITSNDLLSSFKNHYKLYFGKSLNNLQYILDIKLQELFLILIASTNKPDLLNFINSLVNSSPIDLDFIVRKHLFEPVTIPELAKLSGRSTASFKRDFERRFSSSPRQWINQQRLQQAKLLLSNTSKNINEISFECGYESVSHFIKIFKAEFGTTPTYTRKQSALL